MRLICKFTVQERRNWCIFKKNRFLTDCLTYCQTITWYPHRRNKFVHVCFKWRYYDEIKPPREVKNMITIRPVSDRESEGYVLTCGWGQSGDSKMASLRRELWTISITCWALVCLLPYLRFYYRIYVNDYIIFYVVDGDIMEVRRILYEKRDWEKCL